MRKKLSRSVQSRLLAKVEAGNVKSSRRCVSADWQRNPAKGGKTGRSLSDISS
jgi:hypothetical protein